MSILLLGIASLLCESGLQPLDHIITGKIVAAAGRMMEKNIKADALFQLTTLTEQTLPSAIKLIQIGSRSWCCRPPQIDWSIKNQLRAGCNSVIADHHFAELVQQKYHNHTMHQSPPQKQ